MRKILPGHAMRDMIVTGALIILTVALLLFAVWQSLVLRQDWNANAAIRNLARGRDTQTASTAPEVLFAQSRYLLRLERTDEAEGLSPLLAAAGNDEFMAAHTYNLGNQRMREAFRLVEDNRIDDAIPLIRVAQDDYKRTLRLFPGHFDAKWNLDIASRLVRTFPRAPAEEESDESRPRNIWTDLPGLPRGLP